MQTKEIIGKTITNIYASVNIEVGGLDTAECFIELDNELIIEIPFGFRDEIPIKELNKDAVSLFSDLSDIPVCYVNKENKPVSEIADKYQQKKLTVFNRLSKFLFGQDFTIKEYRPYKTGYKENKLKHIKDRKIIDFIWYPGDCEKGLFLLHNGYLISETIVAPHGTGLAGLTYFESFEDLTMRRGNDYLKFSDKQKGNL